MPYHKTIKYEKCAHMPRTKELAKILQEEVAGPHKQGASSRHFVLLNSRIQLQETSTC